jgi:hypothetical protein
MSDLFSFLRKANTGDFAQVDAMTDEEVKKVSPYLLLSWGMGADENTSVHSIMTDMYMNDKVFSLHKHPRLLLKLFVSANCDIDNTRYSFVKGGSSSQNKETKSIAHYYQCSLREARDYARILTDEDKKEILLTFEDSEL